MPSQDSFNVSSQQPGGRGIFHRLLVWLTCTSLSVSLCLTPALNHAWADENAPARPHATPNEQNEATPASSETKAPAKEEAARAETEENTAKNEATQDTKKESTDNPANQTDSPKHAEKPQGKVKEFEADDKASEKADDVDKGPLYPVWGHRKGASQEDPWDMKASAPVAEGEETPWYRHWLFWTLVGGAAATGIGLGLAYGVKHDDSVSLEVTRR